MLCQHFMILLHLRLHIIDSVLLNLLLHGIHDLQSFDALFLHRVAKFFRRTHVVVTHSKNARTLNPSHMPFLSSPQIQGVSGASKKISNLQRLRVDFFRLISGLRNSNTGNTIFVRNK